MVTPSAGYVYSTSDQPWITGALQTPAGEIPTVATRLTWADRRGSWRVRWAFGRERYRVQPRLYAVGKPTEKSPVLVTANYKLSFDRLRSQLGGLDCWLMVLETRGINVWCAAGKGTFGTEEIIRRVASVKLEQIVSNRRLILPQLGAPGVSAEVVKKRCGFRVIYGPILAADLPQFIAAGLKATPAMRRVRFSFADRVVLIPTDLILSAKYALFAAVGFLLLSGLGPGFYSTERVVNFGLINVGLLLVLYLAAAALPPALLPWVPGRSFSLKGMWIGLVLAAGLGWLSLNHPGTLRNTWSLIAWFCFIPAVVSFMAMNFTGSSTYTSLSGVLKEMRVALPLQIGCAVLGTGCWLVGRFV